VPFPRLRVHFPCQLGWLHLKRVQDDEASAPGLGVTVIYKAPQVTASLFIYDNQQSVPDLLTHPAVRAEFDSARRDIMAMHLDVDPWPEEPSDGRDLMQIMKLGPDAAEATMLSLTTARGHFVKQRVSWARDEVRDAIALEWRDIVLGFVGRQVDRLH
jgi:hypothetical protein